MESRVEPASPAVKSDAERPGPAVAPHVHVVLLNWNGWRHTVECLESVFQLSYPSFTVIVCDNGSTDGSLARLRSWLAGELRIVPARSPLERPLRAEPRSIAHVEHDRQTAERGGSRADVRASVVLIRIDDNRGFAGGNNVALRYLLARGATGYAWLLNNDMVVAPDVLDRMIERAAGDATLGGIGATLLEYASPNVVQAAGGGRLEPWQGLPREHSAAGKARGSTAGMHPDRLDFVSMGCLLVPLQAVRRVGLIDERYFLYGEDIDYSLRLKAAGYGIDFVPSAEVWHKGSASTVPRSPTHDYNLLRSALLLVDKFHPRLLPLAMAYLFYRCALPKAVRGEWRRLAVVARAFRDFTRNGRTDSIEADRGTALRPAGP